MDTAAPRRSTAKSTPSSSAYENKIPLPSDVTIEDELEIPSIVYCGPTKLLAAIKVTSGDGLRVTGITREDFSQIKAARSEQHKWRLFFSEADGLVIVTIPTGPHERMAFVLCQHIGDMARDMGLRHEIEVTASTTFEPGSHHPFAGSGEGGGSFTPILPSGEARARPSVVIEVDYTQPMTCLRMKGSWWITASDFAVKIVILAKFTSSQGQITMEQWKAIREDRPGAITARAPASTPARPGCVQTVTISRPGVGNTDTARLDPSSYIVVSDPLRLELREVFLRKPQGGEYDVLFSDEDLKSIAIGAWR